MSKSVVVVNTPDCCEMCYFSLQIEAGSYCLPSRIHGQRMVNAMFGTKLDECPLKEMPRRITSSLIVDGKVIEDGYQCGWNECLDEILGVEE